MTDQVKVVKVADIERPPADAVTVNAPVDTTPEFSDDDVREMWLLGSAAQLQRTYTQRCVSCAHWTPAKLGNHGICDAIPDKANADDIAGASGTVITRFSFGCTLWAELDEDATHERIDLAIRRNLMDDMPEDFDPGEPLKERMRERKQAVDGVAVKKS